MLFDYGGLADALEGIVREHEAQTRLEQAVFGIDTLEEVPLQGVLANGLSKQYAVAREVHYPSSAGRKLTHRARCDLVLSPLGAPLAPDTRPADLFSPQHLAAPGDALWVEVKVAYQFREGGVRHGGYGAQWRNNVVADLRKMEEDPLIKEAALLLVVFNESAEILNKDLDLFETVLAAKEVLAGFRHVRSVPILDRIGHRLCTIALWPTIQRG